MLRGLAILGGVALLEQLHFFIYVLGVLLLFLAYRILRGVDENVDPDNNFVVRLVRKVFPVSGEYHGKHWFVKQEGTRYATPLFVCLAAIVAADIAFAVDSIPAAFAITRDSVLIWMGNIFALLGLRALFVLVEGLIRRFRYLDETIAIVLGIVAVKLLIEDLYKVGPVMTLVDRVRGVRDRDRRVGDRRQARSRRRGEARRAHRVALLLPPNSLSWRSTSASTSSGGCPLASRRALRAITSSRTSSRSAGSAAGAVSRASSSSTSTCASPRSAWRALRASSIWRISASRSPRSTAPDDVDRVAGRISRSSPIPPRPIWS